MDPVTVIGLVSGIIGIAEAFGKSYKAFGEWRAKRKARKGAEQEPEASLGKGSPTVESEARKHCTIHGPVFSNGDGK